MTLVACTIKSNVPAIISDILVTNNAVEAIALPTNVFDINPYLTSKRKPVFLNQKTYIIRENVCVTLAGNVSEMAAFLIELKIRCSYYESVGANEVKNFIEGYDIKNEFSTSAFMILAIENTVEGHEVKQFHYPTDEWDMTSGGIFDTIYACGSGKKDFIHWTKAITLKTDEQSDPLHEMVWRNACYIARLLATERVSLHTINRYWGGGFEIALFDGRSFFKIDKIAYVIFHAYFDDSGNIVSLIPGLVLYQHYYNDILFISAIEVSEFELSVNAHTSTFTSQEGKANMFPVLPIDRKEAFSEADFPPSYSFHTNRIAVGFAFITEKIIMPASYFIENVETAVKYVDGNSLTITLKTEVNNEVLGAARRAYPHL